MANNQELLIDASPTKEFFISMLVRDVQLIEAIPDLVDNCCDGARRLRGDRDDGYVGLHVNLNVSRDQFQISDNCGGITLQDARKHAFRFGREANSPKLAFAIGQFGVGMKRALFKIGNHFRIESRSQNSHFVLVVNVVAWNARTEWNFTFEAAEEGLEDAPHDKRGTTICVAELHETVAASFDSATFRSELIQRLESHHRSQLENGLEIRLNGQPLVPNRAELRQSGAIIPASKRFVLEGGSPVRVWLVAGIGQSSPSDAGWSVFCNDRLIVEADRTLITGWGEKKEIKIPKYHNQFSEFRGFAFFDCEDSSVLPWKTTKSGIDEDSPIYIQSRLEMIRMMRSVIDFLNAKDKEKDLANRPRHRAVEQATFVSVEQIPENDVFVYRSTNETDSTC